MSKKIDLTQGSIGLQLIKLAIPIMLTGLLQMAYNLTDMFWVAKLGSGAVSAVGTAGFFGWMGISVALITKIGLEVRVSQSAGENNPNALKGFIINGLWLTIFLGVIYCSIIFLFATKLINFFKLGNDINGFDATSAAIIYLRYFIIGIFFFFLYVSFTAIYNGLGRSKFPFFINGIGVLLNIILDPLLIYGYSFFPKLGVKGAAIASLIADFTVALIFVLSLSKNFDFFNDIKSIFKINIEYIKKIIKIGFPPSIQSCIFAGIAIITARLISNLDPVAVGVQRLGSQIEAISWMMAGGFSTALATFVGQNYGAKNFIRINKGFVSASYIMILLGVVNSLILILFPELLIKIFINDDKAIEIGKLYLYIMGFCQLHMCIEATTTGAFNGIGKSIIPSIVGIIFNSLRIPVAIVLSGVIGLNGIWWSLSGSSILKGIILYIWFIIYQNKNIKTIRRQHAIS